MVPYKHPMNPAGFISCSKDCFVSLYSDRVYYWREGNLDFAIGEGVFFGGLIIKSYGTDPYQVRVSSLLYINSYKKLKVVPNMLLYIT